MNRYRGLVSMLHRPDDVFRTEGGIAAEEHFRASRLESDRVDLGHMPFVEFDADPLLDPGKSVLLADRQNHVIAWEEHVTQRTGRLDVAVLDVVFQFFEHHARQPAALDHE